MLICQKKMKVCQKNVVPVWKVFLELRGVAILAVVINHAAFFGITQYRFAHGTIQSVKAPFGYPWEMVMPFWIIIQEITRFAVPLFIVFAGHYLACFTNSWKGTLRQFKKFILPFAFWSFIGLLYIYYFFNTSLNFRQFFLITLMGGAQPGYSFIVLILQYYVLGRLLSKLVKCRPLISVIIAAISTLLYVGTNYFVWMSRVGVFNVGIELRTLPESIFPRFLFFFVLGLWIGHYPEKFKTLIHKNACLIYFLAGISAVMLICEHGIIFYAIRQVSPEMEFWKLMKALEPWKITTNIWSFLSILVLIRLGQFQLLSCSYLKKLGKIAYQLYILNGPCLLPLSIVLGFVSVSPAFDWINFICLTFLTVLIPVLLIKLIIKWAPILKWLIGYV